jgi:hypothetical protein
MRIQPRFTTTTCNHVPPTSSINHPPPDQECPHGCLGPVAFSLSLHCTHIVELPPGMLQQLPVYARQVQDAGVRLAQFTEDWRRRPRHSRCSMAGPPKQQKQ